MPQLNLKLNILTFYFFSNRRWGQTLEPLLKPSFRTIARTTKEPTNLNTISQTNANLKQNNPNQSSTTSSTTTVPIETTSVPTKTTTTRKTTTTQTTTPVPTKTATVSIETTAVPLKTTITQKTTRTQKTTPVPIKTTKVPIKTTTVPIKTTTVPIETTTTQKTTTIRLHPKFKNFKDKFGKVKPKTPQGIFETKKTTSTTSLPKIFKNRFNFKLRKNQESTGYFYWEWD